MNTLTNGMPPIHPGEFLRETLDELGLTQVSFAQAIGEQLLAEGKAWSSSHSEVRECSGQTVRPR